MPTEGTPFMIWRTQLAVSFPVMMRSRLMFPSLNTVTPSSLFFFFLFFETGYNVAQAGLGLLVLLLGLQNQVTTASL